MNHSDNGAPDKPVVHTYLMLGGPLHGQHRDLPTTAGVHIDLASGQRYRRLVFAYGQPHPLVDGQVVNAAHREAFVHEAVPGIQAAMGLLADVIVAGWIRDDNPEKGPV